MLGAQMLLIEQKLVLKKRSIKYLEAEKVSLLSKRQPLINLLKERAIKYLKASRIEAEAVMKAAKRPKGVILQYKELVREAGRDEKTLINLENQLSLLKLEKAKNQAQNMIKASLLRSDKEYNNQIATIKKQIADMHMKTEKNIIEYKKTLEKDSAWSKADTNGDNVVSDAELDAALAREEKRIRMDNNDKKEDQIRLLIWFQSVCTVAFVIVLVIPEVIPESRLDHLAGISSTFIISNLGIIGSYIGASAWTKAKENGK